MPTPMPRLLLTCLALGALACGSGEPEPRTGAEGEPPAAQEGEEGMQAPGFTLPLLRGGEVSLAELRGKTVLIDFWATWCPPCEFQIPILNEVYREYRDRDVEILGVSVDTAGPETVASYLEKHEAIYPIALGSEGLARRFGAIGFPALAVVTPEGRVAQVHIGLVEAEELEGMIARAFGDGGPPPAREAAEEAAGSEGQAAEAADPKG